MKILLRIYQCLIMVPLMAVATLITALVTIIGSALGAGRTFGYYPAVAWSRVMCALAFVRVKVSGRGNISPATSYVFVANHQSAYDIFSIYGYLGHNFRWMMKQSLRRLPLVGYACKAAGQIFVDKSSPSALRRTMQAAEKQLAGGMSVVVFPEGARTWDGRVRRFRRGAFLLAEEFGLPVVPVTIDGAFRVLPRFGKLPSPGTIHLTIHAPLQPPAKGADASELIAESRCRVLSALPADCDDPR